MLLLPGVIGRNRAEAIYRVAFLIVHALTGGLLLGVQVAIATLLALAFMVVDVILQVVTNGEGLSTGSMGVWHWPWRFAKWIFDQWTWAAFGKPSSFRWLP